MNEEPIVIEGGFALDDRGIVSYINDFSFENIKRFYVVENFSTETIRAFHGHKYEEKYVFVVKGSALIHCVNLNDEKLYTFTLSEKKPAILKIPKNFANGFKPLEENTKIIFFSTSSLEESKNDDIRIPWNKWGEEIWKVKNR